MNDRGFDSDHLWAFITDSIRQGLPVFRHLVSRSSKSQLYFQNVQFAHQTIDLGSPGIKTDQDTVSPDEWVQANFYQAILTMKTALLLEMNPRPVVRPAGASLRSGQYSWSLPIRQAVEAIHREVDLDKIMFEELHNLLLFGSSIRLTYLQRRRIEDIECPVCRLPVRDGICPACELEVPEEEDGHLTVEVIPPHRVFLYPFTANSLDEVSLIAWVDIVPRHKAIHRLTVIGGLPESLVEAALERVYKTTSDEAAAYTADESLESRSLPEIKDLQRVVRRSMEICSDINMIGKRHQDQANIPLFPITTLFVRRHSVANLHCDLALHFVEDAFIGATEVDFDTSVELFINRRVPGRIYGDGEEALINQQDALNNLLTVSYISALSRSFSVIAGDPTRVNLDDVPRFPNSLIIDVTTGPEQSVKNALEVVPGTPITPDVPALRDAILTNMQILAQVFPVLFGSLPAGVEAYKAIEVLRSQSLRAMRPFVASWCASHKRWLQKALKLAARAWRQPRITNMGGYIFYVDGELIDNGIDNVHLELDPNVIFPTGEQDRRTLIIQGIQSGIIDPRRDEFTRLRIASELGMDWLDDELVNEIERQKHEINMMIATEKFAVIDPYDQHVLHYRVIIQFLRSEYGRYLKEAKPDVYRLIESHGKIHGFLAVKDYERAAAEMSSVGIREWMMEKAQYEDADELARKLSELTPRVVEMFQKAESTEPVQPITTPPEGAPAAPLGEEAVQGTQPVLDLFSLIGQ